MGPARHPRTGLLGALCLALLLLVPLADAQDDAARLGRRTRVEDPSGRALDHFHDALRESERGEGVTRIVVWGASHVASDQFTGELRRRLQDRFGDGGAGLVPIARPFSLYDHADLVISPSRSFRGAMVRGNRRVPGPYGRAGFALDADGPGSGRITPRRSSGRGATLAHVELWALGQPEGGRVELRIDGEAHGMLSTSTEAASPLYLTVDLPAARHRLEVRALDESPLRVHGVLLESGRPGVVLEAFGVPGARLRDRLPWDDESLAAHLARRPADLLVLAYGTNESARRRPMRAVERDAREAITRTRRVGGDASCLVVGPSDWPRHTPEGWRPRPRSGALNELYQRIASEEGCAYFDLLHFQGGAGSAPRWVEAGLMLDDHVHFSDRAHARLAGVLERALLARYTNRFGSGEATSR